MGGLGSVNGGIIKPYINPNQNPSQSDSTSTTTDSAASQAGQPVVIAGSSVTDASNAVASSTSDAIVSGGMPPINITSNWQQVLANGGSITITLTSPIGTLEANTPYTVTFDPKTNTFITKGINGGTGQMMTDAYPNIPGQTGPGPELSVWGAGMKLMVNPNQPNSLMVIALDPSGNWAIMGSSTVQPAPGSTPPAGFPISSFQNVFDLASGQSGTQTIDVSKLQDPNLIQTLLNNYSSATTPDAQKQIAQELVALTTLRRDIDVLTTPGSNPASVSISNLQQYVKLNPDGSSSVDIKAINQAEDSHSSPKNFNVSDFDSFITAAGGDNISYQQAVSELSKLDPSSTEYQAGQELINNWSTFSGQRPLPIMPGGGGPVGPGGVLTPLSASTSANTSTLVVPRPTLGTVSIARIQDMANMDVPYGGSSSTISSLDITLARDAMNYPVPADLSKMVPTPISSSAINDFMALAGATTDNPNVTQDQIKAAYNNLLQKGNAAGNSLMTPALQQELELGALLTNPTYWTALTGRNTPTGMPLGIAQQANPTISATQLLSVAKNDTVGDSLSAQDVAMAFDRSQGRFQNPEIQQLQDQIKSLQSDYDQRTASNATETQIKSQMTQAESSMNTLNQQLSSAIQNNPDAVKAFSTMRTDHANYISAFDTFKASLDPNQIQIFMKMNTQLDIVATTTDPKAKQAAQAEADALQQQLAPTLTSQQQTLQTNYKNAHSQFQNDVPAFQATIQNDPNAMSIWNQREKVASDINQLQKQLRVAVYNDPQQFQDLLQIASDQAEIRLLRGKYPWIMPMGAMPQAVSAGSVSATPSS